MDDRDIEQAVAHELLPNEKVLWAGGPNPAKHFTIRDGFLIPFTMAGAVFGVWFVLLFMIRMHPFVVLFAVIYIPMVVYMTFGRFFAKAYIKKHTAYVMTDKRVIKLTFKRSGQKKKCMSADLMSIQNASVSLGRDKCGTLYFGAVPFYSKLFLNTGMEYMHGYHMYDRLVFFDVDDADQVFDTYRSAKASCQTAGEAL